MAKKEDEKFYRLLNEYFDKVFSEQLESIRLPLIQTGLDITEIAERATKATETHESQEYKTYYYATIQHAYLTISTYHKWLNDNYILTPKDPDKTNS